MTNGKNLLSQSEKREENPVNGTPSADTTALSVFQFTVTPPSCFRPHAERAVTAVTEAQKKKTKKQKVNNMLAQVKGDYQKCQDVSDKSFESCIVRSKITRKGDAANGE